MQVVDRRRELDRGVAQLRRRRGDRSQSASRFTSGGRRQRKATSTRAPTRRGSATGTANTVGYFNVEIAATGTQLATNYGNDSVREFSARRCSAKSPACSSRKSPRRVNNTNSLGTTTASRTMKGIRTQLTAINSTVTASSFAANPHLYSATCGSRRSRTARA
jgi:hypothetical protein